MWAAEPLIKGRANCADNSSFTECAYGIPANVPILYPEIGLSVDIEKTKEIVKEVKPLYWPVHDEAALDELLQQMQKLLIDLKGDVKRLSGNEDGSLPLKPAQKVELKVVWQINPVYEEQYDFLNEITKVTYSYLGALLPPQLRAKEMIQLKTWQHSVSSIDMTFGSTDYTDRKTSKVRVIFEIDPSSERRFKVIAVRYGVIDLLTDVGSWAGLMLASYIILWWYMWITKPFGNVDAYDVRHASDILLIEADGRMAKHKRDRFLEQ